MIDAGSFLMLSGGSTATPATIDPGLWLLLSGTPAPAPVVHPDLWDALAAYLVANVPDLVGGVWKYLAPRFDPLNPTVDLPMPFAVHDTGGGGTISRTSERTKMPGGSFAIAIYASVSTESDRIALEVADAVDNAPLIFVGGRLTSIISTGQFGGTKDPDPGPNGVDVWQSIVTVTYQITRP